MVLLPGEAWRLKELYGDPEAEEGLIYCQSLDEHMTWPYDLELPDG